MFFSRAIIATLLVAISSVIVAAAPPNATGTPGGPIIPSNATGTPGTILSPLPGSNLVPGKPFNFTYRTRAGKDITSYYYTAVLLTTVPDDTYPAAIEFTSGHYFGRYRSPKYTANSDSKPSIVHSELTVPDFSVSPGGYGAGLSAFNQTVWILVLEEYGTKVPTLGSRVSLTFSKIHYNGTS